MHYFFDYSFITLFSKLVFLALFGSLLFFSVVIAPTIFKELDTVNSRKFIRAIFPKLYLWGMIISMFNCIILINRLDISFFISISIFFGFLFSRQVLIPKINHASDKSYKSEESKEKFRKLHSLSVLIFIIQLILIISYCIII
mgnify:CR=1 FL=1|jgi:hypothetical protein